jgi:5'-3' exonuclease
MSGCDYLPSIKGFGFKTGLKFFEKYEVLERVIHNLKYIAKFKDAVPSDYMINAKKVVSLFFLQLVYDPVDCKLRNLTDVIQNLADSDDEKRLKEKLSHFNIKDDFYGSEFDNFKEFCKGELDIKTKTKEKKIESKEVITKYVNRYKNTMFNKIVNNIIKESTVIVKDNDPDKFFKQLIKENDLDEQKCLEESFHRTNKINLITSPVKSDMEEVINFCNSASKTPSKIQYEIDKPKNLYDLLVHERKTEEKPITMTPW